MTSTLAIWCVLETESGWCKPDGVVTPLAYRHALREVIARCIFGVDRNPMAVELTRTALLGFDNATGLQTLRAIEALSAETPEEVAVKEQAYIQFCEQFAHSPIGLAADLPRACHAGGRGFKSRPLHQ